MNVLTRGGLAGAEKERTGELKHSNNELQEVSRGHSTVGIREGLNNHKSEVNEERNSV